MYRFALYCYPGNMLSPYSQCLQLSLVPFSPLATRYCSLEYLIEIPGSACSKQIKKNNNNNLMEVISPFWAKNKDNKTCPIYIVGLLKYKNKKVYIYIK